MAEKITKNGFTPKDVMRKIVVLMCGKYDISGWNENSKIAEIGIESLDVLRLFLELEDAFHIALEGTVFKNCQTLGDVVNVIMKSRKL